MKNETVFVEIIEKSLEEITHRLLDNEPVKAYCAVMQLRQAIVNRKQELAACPPK